MDILGEPTLAVFPHQRVDVAVLISMLFCNFQYDYILSLHGSTQRSDNLFAYNLSPE